MGKGSVKRETETRDMVTSMDGDSVPKGLGGINGGEKGGKGIRGEKPNKSKR